MKQVILLCLAISASSTLSAPVFNNTTPSVQSIDMSIITLACYYSQSKEIQKSQQYQLRASLTMATTNALCFIIRHHFYEFPLEMQELLIKIKKTWYLESLFCKGQHTRDKFCAALKEFVIIRRDDFGIIVCRSGNVPSVLTDTKYYMSHRGKRLLLEDSVEIIAKYVNWKMITIPKCGRVCA